MKKLLLISVILISWCNSFAQPYGNEWINYNQKFYYFPVTSEGIYRIDSTTLANAIGSTTLANLDPRNIQLFARNQEQFIHINGESDGVFNGSDYIEFYAKGNDGEFDKPLFDSVDHQPNPFYSLINDTIFYYITWNSSVSNKRYTQETDVNFPAVPSPYFWRELRYARSNDDAPGYSPTYYYGERFSGSITDSRYGIASGWMSQPIYYGNSRVINYPTTGAYTSGPATISELLFFGQSNASQNPDHHLEVTYGGSQTVVYDTIFDGFQRHLVSFQIPSASLSNVTQVVLKSKNDLSPAPASEISAIGYGLIRYPHIQDLENKSRFRMIIPDVPAGKFYLSSTGFSGTQPIIYDVENGLKIPAQIVGSTVKALIPNAGGDKEVYISDAAVITQVNQLKPVTSTALFTDFNLYSGNYVIITHSSLMNGALTYAAYRSAKYNPVVVDVEELYHQFGVGIRKHPSAIRNFCEFGMDTWSDTLKHLFLLGKSIHASTGRQGNVLYFEGNLVPSLGAKSSDVLLTSGLNGSGWGPALSTGRLAARTTQEVQDYLDKMMLYEGYQSPELWMKNVVHFHGGSSLSEQTLLSFYLNTFKNIITDTLTGARVFDFYKSTTSPVQGLSITDSIRKIINSGTNLLTFFGHAAGSSFDINIDKASTYSNYGKYPLILANSCLVGDIHQYNTVPPTTSEDFVLTPEKGAIGFIASVGLGTPPDLFNFSSELYKYFSYLNYSGPVGTSLKESIGKMQDYYPLNNYLRINVQQMNLHGDPALELYGFSKPDLSVTDGPVWFSPTSVTTDMDSLTLKTVVTNKARAFTQQYALKVVRTFSNGTTDTLIKVLNGSRHSDTVSFTFSVGLLNGGGFNEFTILADETNNIDELSELNNDTTIRFFIKSDDVIPAWPYQFAVLPDADITLKASTGDPFATAKNYRFELDTSASFNSTVKITGSVNAPGGIVSFKPPGLMNFIDSTVFFWRVAADTVTGHKWRSSSFQIISGQTGWGQAHFDQYANDGLKFLTYDSAGGIFSLDTTAKHLIATNIGNPQSVSTSYGIEYKLDALIQDYAGCGWNAALHVVVIDSLTLQPWGKKWTDTSVNPAVTYNPNNNFGNINNEAACRNRVEKYFIFRTNSAAQMDSLASMLNNKIPAGNHVMIYSYLNNMRSQWTPNLVNALSAIGAGSQITSIQDSIPFIFYVKKGYPSTSVEKIGTNKYDIISLDVPLYSNLDYGFVQSPLIGPAKSWNALYMQHTHLESNSSDSSSVSVYGVKKDGTEAFLGSFGSDNVSVLNLGNHVDVSVWPYIRLETYKGDKVLRTPPQLYRWQVLYDPVPELALDPGRHFSFKSPVVQEGENMKASIAVTNISRWIMDSTSVSWYIEDAMRNRKVIQYKKEGPISSDSSRIVSVDFNTRNIVGNHQLYVEVNPKDAQWNLEQYHFNNMASMEFLSSGDRTNPLLDVTFDGMHILNRDIVSPTSLVVIGLKDENKFLVLNDTSKFGVYLLRPESNVPERLNFLNDLQFVPASLPDNSCQIIYKGDFHKDGIYKLMVQATDVSDNKSGGSADDFYEIEFEVINKSTVTEILNYPNPFSTSTRFVFTLTGSQIPDRFRIQILTITGKVVREIEQYELGTIRIGRNITDYAWDGRDMFGDQLANGVYLYRVIAEINGNPIERRASGADSFIHKGFGKMYLLRGN